MGHFSIFLKGIIFLLGNLSLCCLFSKFIFSISSLLFKLSIGTSDDLGPKIKLSIFSSKYFIFSSLGKYSLISLISLISSNFAFPTSLSSSSYSSHSSSLSNLFVIGSSESLFLLLSISFLLFLFMLCFMYFLFIIEKLLSF